MTRYVGTALGLKFDIELKDDDEFEEWLYQKLRKYQYTDIVLRVFDRLLNDTVTIIALKTKG